MGGGLPREGVVVEKFVPSLESLSSFRIEGRNLGCPENWAGCPGPLGVFKKLVRKKVRAHFSFPVNEPFSDLNGAFFPFAFMGRLPS